MELPEPPEEGASETVRERPFLRAEAHGERRATGQERAAAAVPGGTQQAGNSNRETGPPQPPL